MKLFKLLLITLPSFIIVSLAFLEHKNVINIASCSFVWFWVSHVLSSIDDTDNQISHQLNYYTILIHHCKQDHYTNLLLLSDLKLL